MPSVESLKQRWDKTETRQNAQVFIKLFALSGLIGLRVTLKVYWPFNEQQNIRGIRPHVKICTDAGLPTKNAISNDLKLIQSGEFEGSLTRLKYVHIEL